LVSGLIFGGTRRNSDENETKSRTNMPKGTKVDNLYEKLKKQGYSVESAVKIAQSQTGQALATGKPPKKGKK